MKLSGFLPLIVLLFIIHLGFSRAQGETVTTNANANGGAGVTVSAQSTTASAGSSTSCPATVTITVFPPDYNGSWTSAVTIPPTTWSNMGLTPFSFKMSSGATSTTLSQSAAPILISTNLGTSSLSSTLGTSRTGLVTSLSSTSTTSPGLSTPVLSISSSSPSLSTTGTSLGIPSSGVTSSPSLRSQTLASSTELPSATPLSLISCPGDDEFRYISPSGQAYTIDCNTERVASDISTASQSSLRNCIDSCSSVNGCVGVSWERTTQMCSYKSAVGKATIDGNYDSAILADLTCPHADGALLIDPSASIYQVQCNTLYPMSKNITSTSGGEDLSDCASQCSNMAGCVGATYADGTCTFFSNSGTPDGTPVPGVTTLVLLARRFIVSGGGGSSVYSTSSPTAVPSHARLGTVTSLTALITGSLSLMSVSFGSTSITLKSPIVTTLLETPASVSSLLLSQTSASRTSLASGMTTLSPSVSFPISVTGIGVSSLSASLPSTGLGTAPSNVTPSLSSSLSPNAVVTTAELPSTLSTTLARPSTSLMIPSLIIQSSLMTPIPTIPLDTSASGGETSPIGATTTLPLVSISIVPSTSIDTTGLTTVVTRATGPTTSSQLSNTCQSGGDSLNLCIVATATGEGYIDLSTGVGINGESSSTILNVDVSLTAGVSASLEASVGLGVSLGSSGLGANVSPTLGVGLTGTLGAGVGVTTGNILPSLPLGGGLGGLGAPTMTVQATTTVTSCSTGIGGIAICPASLLSGLSSTMSTSLSSRSGSSPTSSTSSTISITTIRSTTTSSTFATTTRSSSSSSSRTSSASVYNGVVNSLGICASSIACIPGVTC